MADSSAVNQALRRLDVAIQSLESAVEGQNDRLRSAAGFEEELHRLGLDRSQLAQALDTAESRSVQLAEANREVSNRLIAAMESIRHVLARQGD